MKIFLVTLLLSVTGMLPAEDVLVVDFKAGFKYQVTDKAEDVFYKVAPSISLDTRKLKAGSLNIGHGFYLYQKDADKVRGKTIRFDAVIKYGEGPDAINANFRIFGNGNKFMLSKNIPMKTPKDGNWHKLSACFSVPELPGIENVNVEFGIRKTGSAETIWYIDEARVFITGKVEDINEGRAPVDSIGMAGLLDKSPLTLIKNGELKFKIVTRQNPDEIAKYAAEELAAHIKLATGKKTEIVTDTFYSGPGIYVGENVISKKYGVTPSMLPAENWVVARVGDAIIISGGENPGTTRGNIISRSKYPLGTLSAAYEFLERFLNVRWYWPGKNGIVVPKCDNLSIRRCFETGCPAYKNRSLFYDIPSNTPDVNVTDILIWQRRIRIGGSLGDPIGMHSFWNLHKKYSGTNPEYFALQEDGTRKVSDEAGIHLCMSNPDTVKAAAEEVMEYFRQKNSDNFYSVMPGDSNDLYFCRCQECLKKVVTGKPGGKNSNLIWGFVNKVAAIVAKEFPGRYVKCCAYSDYQRRPDFPLMSNIAVTLCYPPVPQGSNDYKIAWRKLIDEWGATGATLFIWEYWNRARSMPGSFGIPTIFPRQLKEIYLLDRNQVTGRVIELANVEALTGTHIKGWTNWIFDVQNLYVAARLMWDSNADVEQILEEYYPGFYGPAAGVMRQFYDEMELAWTNSLFLQEGDRQWNWEVCWKKVYTPEFVDRMLGLLQDGVELTTSDPIYNDRAQRTLDGFKPFQMNSILFRGK